VLLKGTKKKVERQTKSFGGKFVLGRKKTSALLNGVWFRDKNILSLLAGKILPCATDFSRQSSLISDQTLFKSAEFFFFLAILHSQKIVKEIAYISTSFQAPFKSAIFFSSFAYS